MNNRNIVTILLMATVIMVIIGATFAYWNWQSNESQKTNVTFTVTSDFSCGADGGGDITNDNYFVPASCTNSTYAIQRTITTSITNNSDEEVRMNLWLNIDYIDSGLANSYNFRYALTTDSTSCTNDVIVSGNFRNKAAGDTIELLRKVTTPGTYYLYVWLDSAEKNASTQNQSVRLSLGGSCNNEDYCYNQKSTLALGDYVSYTPSSTNYPVDTSKTGSSTNTSINPSELTLWRVINLNPIEIVSEYISNTRIWFNERTGYSNYVGYLNTLASQYETSGITIGSRNIGYNGQTLTTDISRMNVTPAPWYCDTGESCNPVESQGGGDTLYQRDVDLLSAANVPLRTTSVNGLISVYWLSSRCYFYQNGQWSNTYWTSDATHSWFLMKVYGSLITGGPPIWKYNGNYAFTATDDGASVRPIVVLSPSLTYSGAGNEDCPMEIITS